MATRGGISRRISTHSTVRFCSPLPSRARRTVIVAKAVLEKSAPVLERYRFFMSLSPHFRHRRMERFLRICAVMVAAYISIYRQTEQTSILYNHRRRHLRATRKQK